MVKMIKLNHWSINSSFKKYIAHPYIKQTQNNMKKPFYPEVIVIKVVTQA